MVGKRSLFIISSDYVKCDDDDDSNDDDDTNNRSSNEDNDKNDDDDKSVGGSLGMLNTVTATRTATERE